MHTHENKEHESTSLIPLIAAKEREFDAAIQQAESKAKDTLAKAQIEAKRIVEEAKKKAAAEAEAVLSHRAECRSPLFLDCGFVIADCGICSIPNPESEIRNSFRRNSARWLGSY